MRKQVVFCMALALVFGAALTHAQNGFPSDALLYNDGTPDLQEAYNEMFNELTLEGYTVNTTSSIDYFSDAIAVSLADVYVAFSANAALVEAWKNLVSDGNQYASFTVDVLTGQVVTEYHSFSPAPLAPLITGEQTIISGGVSYQSGVFSTVTPGSNPPPPQSLSGDAKWFHEEIYDRIVNAFEEAINDLLQKILAKLKCLADWNAKCLDTFIESLPEDAKVTIKVEAQSTPPGVNVSVSVTGTVAQAKQTAKATAKFMKCQAQCFAQCF